MLHLVTADNRELYRAELLEMHRQRKAIFVDDLGWPLECDGDVECDAFDTLGALYLLALEEGETLGGSARLLPSTQPHLLGAVFPELCEEGVPIDDTIWEATRFCPAPGIAVPERRRALLGKIIAGILEAGLLFGMTQVTFVASAALKPLALAAGWSVRPLGASRRYGRERISAFVADVDAAGLRRVRERYGLHAPLLRYLPARKAA
ncbi:MAG: hypothetical protein JNM59_07865 [Hyphomonadaceae bacterium]|nr:hypothetical protein [Hyphomonadaceae bacterium]